MATTEETQCVPVFPWDVIVVNHMVPTHSAISQFEDTLELWASTLGGRNDGWGCMVQPTSRARQVFCVNGQLFSNLASLVD
jgi:hypothetical protein